MSELDKNDIRENSSEKEINAEEIKEIIKSLEARKAEYESISEELAQTVEIQKSLTDIDSEEEHTKPDKQKHIFLGFVII